jgi:glycosyltransferase involved in cell wall biosynthesis
VLTVAYLANRFPAAVEPYVGEEIRELQLRGVQIVPGSARKTEPMPRESSIVDSASPQTLCLQRLGVRILPQAFGCMLWRWRRVAGLVTRVLLRGKESPQRRLKALLHTLLGACYAVQLRPYEIDHIHVHHGYFASWIAMVAARLLNVNFSLTLHGSDLLVNSAYLDTKLENCRFCLTISEYNRRYILEHFPAVDPRKIVVSRLGVDIPAAVEFPRSPPERGARRTLTLLAVGRLHAVKNYSFLIEACAKLRDSGLDFECLIAGEGPERQRLESLIRQRRLPDRVTLLGHVPRKQMDLLYRRADVVVLTSRSEGIPLVLMEAMARGRIVLAPAITGIPELVIPGTTGFLYAPGATEDFVGRIQFLEELRIRDCGAASRLAWIRHAARVQVLHNFSRGKNVNHFCDLFLQRITDQKLAPEDWSPPSHEDLILQQV